MSFPDPQEMGCLVMQGTHCSQMGSGLSVSSTAIGDCSGGFAPFPVLWNEAFGDKLETALMQGSSAHFHS